MTFTTGPGGGYDFCVRKKLIGSNDFASVFFHDSLLDDDISFKIENGVVSWDSGKLKKLECFFEKIPENGNYELTFKNDTYDLKPI